MTTTPILAAALAMLLSGTAIAQTNPVSPDQVPPAIDQVAPSAEAPLMHVPETEGDAAMDHDMAGADNMMERQDAGPHRMRGEGRRGWRDHGDGGHGRRHARHGRHHWRDHHGGGPGQDAGDRGAVLSFSQGEGGPSFRIRCADGDTTLECASAIGPILDRLMPRPAAPAQ